MKREDSESKTTPVGGYAFYLSLFVLAFLFGINIRFLPGLITKDSLESAGFFSISVLLGWLFAKILIHREISVFLHEWKHMIVASLFGNKAKKMKVGVKEGSFEYEYTADTAQANAFIALAPYYFLLFTALGTLAAVFVRHHGHTVTVLPVGFGYGIDLVLNSRDIGPHQTDISNIRGGYRIGMMYVAIINLTLITYLLAWVFGGTDGLVHLTKGLWDTVYKVLIGPGSS